MKTLSETIYNTLNENDLDWFDSNILSHIAIAYSERSVYFKSHYVVEKFGVSDVVRGVAEKIYADFRQQCSLHPRQNDFKFEYDNTDFENLDGVFFNELELNIEKTDDTDGAQYKADSRLDFLTFRLNKVIINAQVEYEQDLLSSLLHELTHAYNNYKLLLKGDKKFKNLIDSGFYAKLMPQGLMSFGQNYVRIAMYFTLGIERNAFIAQLTNDLKSHSEEIESPIDALNVLRQSEAYDVYKQLIISIEKYKAGKLKQEIADDIAKEYNYISGTNLTTNRVFKKLEILIQKSLKKFERMIGNLCYDWLENKNTTIPSRTYLK